MQVPPGSPRLVSVAGGDGCTYVLLEDVIRAQLAAAVSRPDDASRPRSSASRAMPSSSSTTRAGARISRWSSAKCAAAAAATSSGSRCESGASEELLALLRDQLDVGPTDVYAVPGPLDLRVLFGLTDLPGFDDAARSAAAAGRRASAEHEHDDLFEVLDERDVLLHHPYDAYDPVVALVAQAADDPDVLAIKQTLYRTSVRLADHRGAAARGRAQQAGDRAGRADRAVRRRAQHPVGARARGGRARTSSTASAATRPTPRSAWSCAATPHGLRRYVHLGTGNYNERTARIYTDFGLLTSSPAIAEDATAFFNALTGYSDPPRMKKLVMAPTRLAAAVPQADRARARRAEARPAGEIVAKINSLVDEEIIGALYDASQAGVRDPPQRARHLLPAPGREGRQREHRGGLGRRPLPRARAHLLLPQRRRRRGLPGERRLDDAQPRQARRADVPGRGPRAQERGALCAPGHVPRQREGPLSTLRRHVRAKDAPRPANSRSGSSSISRTRRAAARPWRASALA